MTRITKIDDLLPVFLDLERWRAHVQRLKEENLHATERLARSDAELPSEKHRARTPKGDHTDLERPEMGMQGTRFSRNVPLADALPDMHKLLCPDPRRVSEELLKRPKGGFQPAVQVNMLAAAWIQFQVHDWMGHKDDESEDREVSLPAADGLAKLRVRLTEIATGGAPVDSAVPSFSNTLTHWWDGSQIYGSDPDLMKSLRVDGETTSPKAELRLEPAATGYSEDLLLPFDEDPENPPELTGFRDNWWVGLSLMHTLFAREHNAICDALRRNEPALKGDEDAVYHTARLVNTALMAKIHTVEWTPAMLDDFPIRIALYADWWGIPDEELLSGAKVLLKHRASFEGQELEEVLRELAAPTRNSTKELLQELAFELHPKAAEFESERKEGYRKVEEYLTGLASMLAGRPPDRRAPTQRESFGEPFPADAVYAMTEEFVSVYRMHALIPDTIEIVPVGYLPGKESTGQEQRSVEFKHCTGRKARTLVEQHGMATLIYSFGHTHPGLLGLDNFPQALRELTTDKIDKPLDLAAVDILRDRERGIPRYTRFRQAVRGDTIVTFEDLTGASALRADPKERERRRELARRLREVYGFVEDVDTMVGLFAETPRNGFAFSETTFFLFALMAPLRLRCDRFYTDDYREEAYTSTGIAWITNNTMKTVLARHYGGELSASLMNVTNPFEPWPKSA